MKQLLAVTLLALAACALAACGQVPRKEPVAPLPPPAPAPQEQAAAVPAAVPAATPAGPAAVPAAGPLAEGVDEGLRDLAAVTLGCPKAALNAAAREAAKAPTQGTYQFSYFRIINDSHHASYEVRFKSNYQDEAELKYCVSMYCQQGWDPRTTRTSVRLMGRERGRATAALHEAACGREHAPMNRRSKR